MSEAPDWPAWAREHPWLLERLGRWFAQHLTGEFKVSFRHGRPMHTREDVLGQPPPDGTGLSTGCPKCGGPLREGDYSNRLDCVPCGQSWTRSELDRVRRLSSGQISAH